MEKEREICCNPLEGIVALPLAEYNKLVRESACNSIIREYLAEEGKDKDEIGYVDGNFIRRVLGVDSKEV